MRKIIYKTWAIYLLFFIIAPLHLLHAEETAPKLEKVTVAYVPTARALAEFVAVASLSFPGSLKVAQLAGALEDERNNHQMSRGEHDGSGIG